jgi:hypothetical protein
MVLLLAVLLLVAVAKCLELTLVKNCDITSGG